MAEGPKDVEKLTADKLNLLRDVIRREVEDLELEPDWDLISEELELPYWSIRREGTAIWENDYCSPALTGSGAVFLVPRVSEEVSVTDPSGLDLVSLGHDVFACSPNPYPTPNLNPYRYPIPKSRTPTTTQIQSLFCTQCKPITFRPSSVVQHSAVVNPANVENDPRGKSPSGTISDATSVSREIVEVPLFLNTDSTACWINTVMHVMLGTCFQFLSLLSVALHQISPCINIMSLYLSTQVLLSLPNMVCWQTSLESIEV
jgi:hypothetical protein